MALESRDTYYPGCTVPLLYISLVKAIPSQVIFQAETCGKFIPLNCHPSRIVVNHFSEKKEWSLELPGKEEVSYSAPPMAAAGLLGPDHVYLKSTLIDLI